MGAGPVDPPLTYELLRQDASGARRGRIATRHGPIDTPAFMPVGTQGTVKGLMPDQLAAAGAQCILANTYHLMLRPGEDVVAQLGDLHGFMGWNGPILTDSGGFQVFSLSDINRINDQGVTFKSHIDGARVELTPKRSMEVQNALGADLIMAFDECPPADAPREYHLEAMRRTIRWAEICRQTHQRPNDQTLLAIVQGGVDLSLRRQCAEALIGMDFPGYAMGGLAVGEGFEAMVKVLDAIVPILPADRPRYLMGVGYPRDIVAAVAAGIDLFDCVLPTRNGRNAYAFTADGPIRLRNSRFRRDAGPIEPGCDCPACRRFTRGAIRHFFFAGEMLGPALVSLHNVWFYQRLMEDIRAAIAEGRFEEFRRTDRRCGAGSASADLVTESANNNRVR